MKDRGLTAAVIGKDGRTSAIERALTGSPRVAHVVRLSDWKGEPPEQAIENVLRRARESKPDFVFIGPEDPLAHGIVDRLQEDLGIPCVGPTKELARLESSKAFARDLLSKHGIPGNPRHRVFKELSGIEEFLRELGEYVVKPDGLTGGKGVKISNVHLFSVEEALRYCEELFEQRQPAVVIEERLDGEEFSLQSFCDGTHVQHTILVQDHKRAFEGDRGPNTGGMGSYSCENGSLPFLQPGHLEAARAINAAVAQALLADTGRKYKGILYGGFMATRDGVRLLEYNARLGDPEALNLFSVLQTDLVDICEAVVEERLHELPVRFEPRATVCKYLVPEGYPDRPVKGKSIDLSDVPPESESLRIYHAAVEEREGRLHLTGSRAIAFVGIGKDLDEAQRIAEEAASRVKGPVFHRKDIGTRELIQSRIDHMKELSRAAAGSR